MKTDTWYVLEDGTKADPKDVSADESGALRHSSGVAVAMRGDVPRTSGTGEPAAVVPESPPGLADMTVAELKELATSRGIDLGDATKKADIAAVIERAITAAGGGLTYQTR